MTRRRMLLLGLLATVVTLAAVWLLWPGTAITRENAVKIRVGMTQAEVETILGGLPRDESSRHVAPDINVSTSQPAFRGDWHSDDAIIVVCFDVAGRVISTDSQRVGLRESPIDKLRRWLRI